MAQIDDLRSKIVRKLDEPKVVVDGDIISLYELDQYCKEEMDPYNKFFYEDTKELIKKLNSRTTINNIFGKDIPFVERIVQYVTEDGRAYIKVSFLDSKYNRIGSIEIESGEKSPILTSFDRNKLSNPNVVNFLQKCNDQLRSQLVVLEIFKSKFPNISYKWGDKYPDEKSKYMIQDDFLTGTVDLNSVGRLVVNLSYTSDYMLATQHSKDYGKLYDYIDFYNSAYQKRIAVNINDLNLLMKTIVQSKLKSLNDEQRKLSK